VDHFGNLITNIGATTFNSHPQAKVSVGPTATCPAGARVPRRVRTYAEAQPGELVALVCSSGLLEVAVVRGNAAHHLGAAVGSPVRVEWAT
jgi:S-adenosylmethionine hydrolase